MFSRDYLNECFTYNPDTGVLSWKTRPREHFNTDRSWKRFNSTLAGTDIINVDSHGYVAVRIGKKLMRVHRVAWVMMTGEVPKIIDHINRIKNDNRWVNLRNVDCIENNKNLSMKATNTSGHTGIYWNSSVEKWQAYINVDKRSLYLGIFDELDDAIIVRKDAEIKYNYHENHGVRQ